jgi:RNA polymerase sigma-70 factor (ECF subfamily)
MRSVVTHPSHNTTQPLRSGAVPTAGLQELYERNAEAVYRLAYRLTGTSSDAEDVVQDVFVGLPEALNVYQEQGRLDAWIRKVAARVALSKLRHQSRRREIPLDIAPESMTQGHADAVVSQVTLQRALDRLPEALRAVLILKELEGYSHPEIAEMLGIKASASQVRLHRAHQKLRQILRNTL